MQRGPSLREEREFGLRGEKGRGARRFGYTSLWGPDPCSVEVSRSQW